MKLRLVALYGHRECHLALRVSCLIGLQMEVEVIRTVDKLLSVVTHCHRLALARTNLTADRLRREHCAPVGVLADTLHSPSKLVCYSLEA